MAAGEGGQVLRVAAADHPQHRDVTAQAMIQHGFVTGRQAGVGELQVAQGVVLVHVDTGVVEHQVRLVDRQQIVERVVDHLEVVGVAHAAWQGDVPVAACLACREVLLAVQGHGDRLRLVFQQARGAVALMHVAVEDQHPLHASCREQVAGDHRQVVEDAEARGEVVVRVVRATGQVAGQAMPQRQFGGQQRAAHGAHGTPRQGVAPGQAEAALILRRQLAGHVAGDVVRAVHQGQDLRRAQLGAQQFGIRGQATGDQVIAQQAELLHGETVPGREGRAVVLVVDQRQRHTLSAHRIDGIWSQPIEAIAMPLFDSGCG